MRIYKMISGELAVNTYFIVNEDLNEAVVIDPGTDATAVLSYAREKGFTIKNCLLTHGHFDHALCVPTLQEKGVKVYICSYEKDMLADKTNLAYTYGFSLKAEPDFTFEDGEVLNLSGLYFKVIHTPGHTKGSCCFIIDNVMFTGDTLFLESVGRTDLPTGDFNELIKSIKKLFSYKTDYLIYPGHDESTTLNYEKRFNPYAANID